MEFSEDYIIDEVYGTPLFVNNEPVLVLQLGVPETDISWHSPAFFNGSNYLITTNYAFEVP